ncbi:MAG TPA: nucleotidyltransferase domain-containing protein [Nitrospirae bacterium]|nr:nucleotidyltransferase domain-containing protein [Nitrospirota bacterium]
MQKNNDIKRIVGYFKGRKEVSALYLFGSLANGGARRESDIDLAVLIDEKLMEKKSFNRLKNDYYQASPAFSLRSVDIVILNTASLPLRHRILKTGKILFDRNRKFRVDFTTKSIIRYLDFKPIEDIFRKAVADRFRRASVGR